MKEITTIEQDVAKEVINIGLCHAADSLSFFTRERVLIQSVNFSVRKIQDFEMSKTLEDINYMLSSEIRGEMSGYCALIFSQSEVENLYKIALPESILNNPVKLKDMGKAILLEAKNILTASVVTQFSDLLGYKMHGYIPDLEVLEQSQVEPYILNTLTKYNHVLHFRANFLSDSQNIAPEFVWALDEKFMYGVQNLIEKHESLNHLRGFINKG